MFDFGSRLKAARVKKGYTQSQVMQITHISDKSISRYETNASFPDADTIRRLLDLYDVSADYLFGLSELFDNNGSDNETSVLSKTSVKELCKLSAVSRKKAEEYIKLLYVYENALNNQ